MADLVQNVQQVYKKWESKSRPRYNSKLNNRSNQDNTYRQSHYNSSPGRQNTGRWKPKSQNMERAAPLKWEKRNRGKFPQISLPKYHGIAQFKMSPVLVLQNRQRPFMGSCCQKCFPQSRSATDDNLSRSLGIRDILQAPNEVRNTFLPRTLYEIFFLLKRNSSKRYKDVASEVLKNERLQLAVLKASHSDSEHASTFSFESLLSSKEWNRVKRILQAMKSCFSTLLLRFSGWFLFLFLGRILNSVNIHLGQIEVLAKVSKKEIPIIYLPLHRSYLDYFLITFILHMHNLQSPLIAIAERLQYPVLGNVLRYFGAFHTSLSLQGRVKLKGSVLHALQQSYIGENMKAGHNMEFFLEGCRSQSGKSCTPRSELVSSVLESLIEGHIDDAYIVPVAISYEKLLDGSFINEQLGKEETQQGYFSTLGFLWNIFHSNCGSVRVDFCQPFTLKEFLHSTKHANVFKAVSSLETPPSSPSACPGTLKLSAYEEAFSELIPIVKDLGQHAIYDATNSTALMSTHLLSFLLLTKHRKGATQEQLLYSLDWLRRELSKRKWDIGFTGESLAALKHAVNLLGKELIELETLSLDWASSDMENNNVKLILYKPVVKLPYVLELQYYANAVIPVFLTESVVANALFALLDREIEMLHNCDSKLTVMRQQLVDKAIELTDVLQFEFMFAPPCRDISSVINDAIEDLTMRECLQVCGVVNVSVDGRQSSQVNRCSYDFLSDDEECYVERDQELKVLLSEESISTLHFLRCILSPYIESYWLAACALLKLVNEEQEEMEFFHEMQKTAQERLHKGFLAYEESFAAESLHNALKLFNHWKITEHCDYNSIRIVYLLENFNFVESVAEVISKIEQFRK